jgi:hypothetical protein
MKKRGLANKTPMASSCPANATRTVHGRRVLPFDKKLCSNMSPPSCFSAGRSEAAPGSPPRPDQRLESASKPNSPGFGTTLACITPQGSSFGGIVSIRVKGIFLFSQAPTSKAIGGPSICPQILERLACPHIAGIARKIMDSQAA